LINDIVIAKELNGDENWVKRKENNMTLRDQGAGTASVIDIILPSERLYQSNKQQEDLKRFEKKVQEKF